MNVLFLCLGNICRSPLAEGAFRALLRERGITHFEVDSAGTGAWHVGESPDPRSVRVAQQHGVDISAQRARQLHADDFAGYDWIVAMDQDNLRTATTRRPTGERYQRARLVAMVDVFPESPGHTHVPDPYYGGHDGFHDVWTLLTTGMPHLIAHMQASTPTANRSQEP